MSTYKDHIINVSQNIFQAATPSEEAAAAELLSQLFFTLSDRKPNKSNETTVSGGIALSSYDAAICVNEHIRTARFIKGTHLAILELFRRFPGERINILYAGCGPFATILMPLLAHFSEDSISVTLVDINEHSIRSVKELVSKLGFDNYFRDITTGDLIHYRYPGSAPLHLVVSETMFQALIREPQVPITANLAPQITENGILVPEEIRTELVCTFHAKEPYFLTHEGAVNMIRNAGAIPQRVKLDTLFSMNKQQNFSDLLHTSARFESEPYQVPVTAPESPDLCIFTSLVIFGDIRLGYAESSITNPHPVTAISNMTGHSRFRLIYDFNHIPSWTLQLEKE